MSFNTIQKRLNHSTSIIKLISVKFFKVLKQSISRTHFHVSIDTLLSILGLYESFKITIKKKIYVYTC